MRADDPVAASEQGLADRRDLCLIAVERTRMPMVVTDAQLPDNPIVLANQAFLELTGYSADEILGRNCRFLQGADTSAHAVAQVRAAIAAGREINVELLNYRKNGVAFWNRLHLSPIHDDDGRLLYFFASQEDATELRRVQALEAAEHRLLREVDHRALNALSIVTGIVRLTKADDPALYAAGVQRRVGALVRAHNLLAERGWRGASLDTVIRIEAEPYGAHRVVLEGPHVEVDPLHVQPLALVIHEMISNAALHGALSNSGGTIHVKWDSADRQVSLSWIEAGGPTATAGAQPGFGTAIIEATLGRQLGGALQASPTPGGLHAELQFRAGPDAGAASSAA